MDCKSDRIKDAVLSQMDEISIRIEAVMTACEAHPIAEEMGEILSSMQHLRTLIADGKVVVSATEFGRKLG